MSNVIFSLYNSLITKRGEIDDPTEAFKKIEEEQWQSDSRRDFWRDFTLTPTVAHPLLDDILRKFEREGIFSGTAIDFGCGNSLSAIYLLQKGWNVVAVDDSDGVLDNFSRTVERIDEVIGLNPKCRIKLVCQQMETYTFPHDVRIIFANDSLPYCDPKQFQKVWDNAYQSLEKGGRIVGSFFLKPKDPITEFARRVTMGEWYTDMSVVNALLKDRYKKEICRYAASDVQKGPRRIEFIGHKI